MNENLPPKTPTYDSWLSKAITLLQQAGIESARLDAELLLSHTANISRTYLHAHGDNALDGRHEGIANARLELRKNRTPLAYIIGHKEFYGRRFKTTPAALIPRPESETIIELLKGIVPKNISLLQEKLALADVGTGTGCLGITAKLEWPELDVTLIDINTHVLNLAKENAKVLDADVKTLKNDLLGSYGMPLDIIVANLPYVDRDWEVSPETRAEPDEALYATNHGLALIYRLLEQAPLWLRMGGHVLIESDTRQQNDIIAHAKTLGYQHDTTEGFITVFSR